MKIRASFVIAAYNCQTYIAQAVNSCLAQNFPKVEVVAVNDASADGTGKVLDYLAGLHPNLKVIHLTENKGRSMARNIGIEAAKGETILILDGDDVSLPNRASDTINYLKKNPGVEYVYGKFQIINEVGNIVQNVECEPFNLDNVKKTGWTHICHSTVALRKSLFDRVKYTDGEWSNLGVDDWKYQVDAYNAKARFGAIQKTLSQYRYMPKTRDEKRIMELKSECLSAN